MSSNKYASHIVDQYQPQESYHTLGYTASPYDGQLSQATQRVASYNYGEDTYTQSLAPLVTTTPAIQHSPGVYQQTNIQHSQQSHHVVSSFDDRHEASYATAVNNSATPSRGSGINTSVNYNEQAGFQSEVEKRTLRAQQHPAQVNENSEGISVNGERGLWANQAESANWRGDLPIHQYRINQDTNPEMVKKQTNQNLEVFCV
jgi:hypothetical protein